MKQRREYPIKVEINGRKITKVVIDPHYEDRHSKVITDELILELVKLLHRGTFPIQGRDGDFEYFVADGLKLRSKKYKIIWLFERNKMYIGVVNAYRRKSK